MGTARCIGAAVVLIVTTAACTADDAPEPDLAVVSTPARSVGSDAPPESRARAGADEVADTGRLIVQVGGDRMAASFEGWTLHVDPDGCTSADVVDGARLDVIWPPGTSWSALDRSVVLHDGTRLVDGSVFTTGGGAIPMTDDEVRSAERWIDQSTVDDETLACLVGDEVLVIGDFEAVLDV